MRAKIKKTLTTAAKEAGKILKKYFYLEKQHKGIKGKGFRDVVTAADLESEKKIISIIEKNFPEHSIIAEESGYENKGSDYTWVIDPLDGTMNFSKGMDIFCVSIGVAQKGKVIMAAVFDPVRKYLYFAEKGKGAFLNCKRIFVSEEKELGTAIVFSQFDPTQGKKEIDITFRLFRSILRKSAGIRVFVSLAQELCHIAKGSAACSIAAQPKPWDFAAGCLIVEEAGGKVTDFDGKPWTIYSKSLVSTNGLLHRQLLSMIRKAK
ncbi:inositol monophosphatase [Candidatus Woesearchaeota archaeon]|nr:inositol monophosphatase [Candidatus Woesearchaeota archaeon]